MCHRFAEQFQMGTMEGATAGAAERAMAAAAGKAMAAAAVVWATAAAAGATAREVVEATVS